MTPPAAPTPPNERLALLVDDDEDSRELFRLFLERRSWRLEEAVEGKEALARAAELVPAIVLLDVSLPGMSGLEVAARLKRDERTRHVPIIAITGHDLVGAQRDNFDDIHTKPIDLERLHASMIRLVEAANVARPQ